MFIYHTHTNARLLSLSLPYTYRMNINYPGHHTTIQYNTIEVCLYGACVCGWQARTNKDPENPMHEGFIYLVAHDIS